ncbi:TIGR00270 family protein [Candidatus Micrarchaeota archaeon]|nr:TIGR00270 family protein [Candidatus Micrarchaeota archaeon]
MSNLSCDICGKTPVRAQILVEGAKMLACGMCMRSGKMLYKFEEDAPITTAPAMTAPASLDSGEEIVDDWAKILRTARERMTLPLEVIAERIKEKESYLHAIESGRLLPSLEVARKLEKELKVKLIEKVLPSITASTAPSGKFSEPTRGDILISDKMKKEK